MGSLRAELARHVLEMLAHGHPVPTHDAFQLRNWAVCPEDVSLSLEEIAHGILNQEEEPNETGADPPYPAKKKPGPPRKTVEPFSTTKSTLREMLPGVREVEEHSCIRCGSKGYVLPGLSLDLRNRHHQLVYMLYMEQRPLLCERCCVSYCQNCAWEAMQAGQASAHARARIAQQQLEEAAWNPAGDKAITFGFCPQCGEAINYA